MAARLAQDLGIQAELVIGRSGEFTVWVDDAIVAKKDAGRFPAPEDVVGAIRASTR